MKRSSKELKQLARNALNGNYGIYIGALMIYMIIGTAVEMIPSFLTGSDTSVSQNIILLLVSIILSLLISVLAAGMQRIALQIARQEPAQVGDLFFAFRNHPDKFLIVTLFMILILIPFLLPGGIVIGIGMLASATPDVNMVGFGSLLLILFTIIGAVFLMRYSLVIILLVDRPELGTIETMRLSRQLMKGNVGRYFYIQISFIGLGFLNLLSLGLASFWITPYTSVTLIEFYRDVTGELDAPDPEVEIVEEPSWTSYWSES